MRHCWKDSQGPRLQGSGVATAEVLTSPGGPTSPRGFPWLACVHTDRCQARWDRGDKGSEGGLRSGVLCSNLEREDEDQMQAEPGKKRAQLINISRKSH